MGSFDEISHSILPSYSTSDPVVDAFYVPLLARSLRYDRVAGYFTSWGLALAARGLTQFVQGSGTMRLIVGAQLSAADVAAVEDGADLAAVVAERLATGDLWEDVDEVRAHRLHVLAWLAKEQRLEIKVGVPRRSDGRLVPADETNDYFHDKFGIFTDDSGTRVAFNGSNNDSLQGWMGNSESFSVYPEWHTGTWDWNGIDVVKRFDRYWKDEHSPEWKVVSLSDAVQKKLLRVAEYESPPSPLEPEAASDLHSEQVHPALEMAEIVAIPRHRPFTGVASAGVEPLPHQRAVVDRAVRSFPRGFLFGDEVGLGKTIEVGLTVRELTLSGAASRTLILVPAAVLTQWQEELWEKIGLWVPRWDSGEWIWPDGSATKGSPSDPWTSTAPVVLASSHLARRNDHRRRIVAASPWDIVVVDEAHHARRRGGKPNGTPNTLLQLLQELRDRDGWQALYLASATPMQMYPHEAWDLIELFGLTGRWAEDAQRFEQYFKELSVDWPQRQWTFLARMIADHFADPETRSNLQMDQSLIDGLQEHPQRKLFLKGMRSKRSVVVKENLCRTVGSDIVANKSWHNAVGADPKLASLATAWLYTNNPMRDRVFRNTRDTLRAYRAGGFWPESATIPDRLVNDRPVKMTDREQDLYCRVQDYIRTNYDRAQEIEDGQKRNALGFILTVYRRRLTSSFHSIEQSLRRRVALLDGQLDADSLLTADDTRLGEVDADVAGALKAWALDDEIHTLRQLADDIGVVASGDESKMLALHEVVDAALTGGHRTVLVFTQYADTMTYVRDRLDAIYRGGVIGYASSGGTIRNTTTGEWEPLSKRETKDLFTGGERVRVLVGTDTLAEGLNLQTCGRLINYDLPWNFTRVEQRIGRVDRIGGLDTVLVTNMLYEGTVETAVYQKLVATFGGFNAVVGIAQPVLGHIEEVIQQASLTDLCDDHEQPTGRVAATLFDDGQSDLGLDDAVARVIQEAGDSQARTLSGLDEHGSPIDGTDWPEAVDLDELAGLVLALPGIDLHLTPHQSWEGVFELGTDRLVTFDRTVLAELSPDVQLLSWGTPAMDDLVRLTGTAAEPADGVSRPPTIAEQTGTLPLGDSL